MAKQDLENLKLVANVVKTYTDGKVSELNTSISNETTRAKGVESTLNTSIDTINSKISSTASSTNKLVDKSYVDNLVSTSSATFRGTLNIVTDLKLSKTATNDEIATALVSYFSGTTITNNDYCYVAIPDDITTDLYDSYKRFKYCTEHSKWEYEYSIDNPVFSESEWNAIRSGITSDWMTQKSNSISTNTQNISNINAKIPTEATSGNQLADKSWVTNNAGKVNTISVNSGTKVSPDTNKNINITITKGIIDLGNVVNTGDSATPTQNGTTKFTTGGAYTLQQSLQTSINTKANSSDLTSHTSDTSNPHQVTKEQVGLGNVDNTSDINKPISTATQTALNNKVSKTGDESISGTKTFTGVIKVNEIDNTSGNAMVRYKSTEAVNVFGGVGYNITLMGKDSRPYYSNSGSDFTGSGIALLSDFATTDEVKDMLNSIFVS